MQMARCNRKKLRGWKASESGGEQNNYDFQWSEAYAAAKRYFEEYGSLNVPIAYTTADGIALGKWVARQQYAPQQSRARATASSRRSA